jgi:hypothetical protein
LGFRNSIFFTAFLLLGILESSGEAKQYGDVLVEASSPPNAQRSHGYGEYRIAVSNRSLKDRHQVTLTLPQQSYSGGTVTRTITVEPSSTVSVSLFTSIALGGNGLGVEIDGQPQRDVVAVTLSSYGYENRPRVLISQGASARAFDTRAGTVLKNAEGKENFYAAKSETPVAEWSTNWLGFSSYDGVVLTADEMRAMPEPAASALIRYAECGGALLVIGSWQVPQPWRIEKEQDGALLTYNASFGVCMVSENGAVEGLSKPNWEAISDAWEQSQLPWAPPATMTFDNDSANRLFPVTENVSIPVRGLLLIMLLFVIVIGPVNLFVLSKKKKRMWLLWTVPLISLLTCLAVSAYTVLSEGWAGRARYLSYTILDERSHRASTIGLNAFYAPLTPGDGLRYGTETEITAQGNMFGGYPYDRVPTRTADWTDDQHLETGWVTARTPAHFMIRRAETRRERLTLTRSSDGSLSVVNGLGVPIRNLWLADEKGIVYKGSDIAAGASAILEMTKEHVVTAKDEGFRGAFKGDWMKEVQRTASSSDLVRPRTYVADLDACPFLEEGLKDVKQKKCEARVYGIMKGPGDED